MPSMPAGNDIEDWLASIRNPPRPPSVPNGPKGNAPAMERAAAAAAAAADGRYSDDKHWFCWSGADAAGGDTTRLLLLDCSLIILSDWTIISLITAVDNCGVVREKETLESLLVDCTNDTHHCVHRVRSEMDWIAIPVGAVELRSIELGQCSVATTEHSNSQTHTQTQSKTVGWLLRALESDVLPAGRGTHECRGVGWLGSSPSPPKWCWACWGNGEGGGTNSG